MFSISVEQSLSLLVVVKRGIFSAVVENDLFG